MSDQRLQRDLRELVRDPLGDAAHRRPLESAPARAPLTGGRGSATYEAPVATATGGGPPLPWTWVSNQIRTDPVTTSDSATFDEDVIEIITLRDADGNEFTIPTGL